MKSGAPPPPLHIPRGLAACVFTWCVALEIRYGYDAAATGDGSKTLTFTSAGDRAKLLAMIKEKCDAMRPYNPAFAALYDQVR